MARLTVALTLAITVSAAAQSHPAHRVLPATAAHRRLLAVHPAAMVVAATPPAPVVRSSPRLVALVPAPFSQNPINQLLGSARALLLFAPDANSPYLRTQMAVLNHHELELTERDTVFVPLIDRQAASVEQFPGENLNPGTASDQLSARQRFGLQPNDFAVILLDKDGREFFRSNLPVSVDVLTSRIDTE